MNHRHSLLRPVLWMLFLAVAINRGPSAAAAPSTNQATLTAAQRQSLAAVDAEIAHFESLIPAITDTPYRMFVTGVLDELKEQRQALSVSFDQARYDDLRLRILVESNRVMLWMAPPKAKSLPDRPPSAFPVPETKLDRPKHHDSSKPNVAATQPTRSVPTTRSTAAFSPTGSFIDRHCVSCHDETDKKGGLDLTSLPWPPADPANFSIWVKVHDRIESGEMPPKKSKRPDAVELDSYLHGLSAKLVESEHATIARDGRAPQRRLNAYEYENALRDLLHVPWMQIKGGLPDDGVANRFNKSGKALDISHVQLARFISSSDAAIREAISVQAMHPATTTRRFYARDQKYLIKEYQLVPMNTSPDRQNFPLIGNSTDVDTRLGRAPLTVGAADPAKRELEAVGWLGIAFPKWDRTPIPVGGHYRLRFSGYTIWAGPNGYSGLFKKDEVERKQKARRWFIPDVDDVSAGRRDEPVSIYAEGGNQNRRLGGFDLSPDPSIHELDVWLGSNDSVMPRATRLCQPRPSMPTNPNAQRDGAPGVAFRWLEIEGPIYDDATTAGYRLMFGDLPLTKFEKGGEEIGVASTQPKVDAERLLRGFLRQAYRRPAEEIDVQALLALINAQLDAGAGFADAMIAGYTAALASPGFLVLEEKPGLLDDYALAARLSFFLWNSPPDVRLRALAATGELHQSEVLRRETDRLLSDPKAARFVEAFLDYWLDLRRIEETTPSITLYNDYYLDDALIEAALAESRLFFSELVLRDLPARNIVSSDFTFLNERLAAHYDLPGVKGVSMRRVALPAGSPRGGVLTQASVLKVTANGTTTSPVLRGKWIMERILGYEVPPPPPVGTVEPDIRGAVTIRQQLDKHRADASCASCHSKIDPPGFALESFDILGGWREQYRAVAPGKPTVPGFGKNGAPFEFHLGLPVDATGSLPDGRRFKDVREFKRLLIENDAGEAGIARNLVQQFVIYATGSPARFSERETVEQILQRTRDGGYGVRALISELIQSKLFRTK